MLFQCVTDSSKLSENTVSFIARNPLMHEAVPSVRSKPILVQGPERASFTQIAVLPKVCSVFFFFDKDFLFRGWEFSHLINNQKKVGDLKKDSEFNLEKFQTES